jgi:hypothetical protein
MKKSKKLSSIGEDNKGDLTSKFVAKLISDTQSGFINWRVVEHGWNVQYSADINGEIVFLKSTTKGLTLIVFGEGLINASKVDLAMLYDSCCVERRKKEKIPTALEAWMGDVLNERGQTTTWSQLVYRTKKIFKKLKR